MIERTLASRTNCNAWTRWCMPTSALALYSRSGTNLYISPVDYLSDSSLVVLSSPLRCLKIDDCLERLSWSSTSIDQLVESPVELTTYITPGSAGLHYIARGTISLPIMFCFSWLNLISNVLSHHINLTYAGTYALWYYLHSKFRRYSFFFTILVIESCFAT